MSKQKGRVILCTRKLTEMPSDVMGKSLARLSAGSTIGKMRRQLVKDAVFLADLGCHAFKDGIIPKGRSVMRHNLSQAVPVR